MDGWCRQYIVTRVESMHSIPHRIHDRPTRWQLISIILGYLSISPLFTLDLTVFVSLVRARHAQRMQATVVFRLELALRVHSSYILLNKTVRSNPPPSVYCIRSVCIRALPTFGRSVGRCSCCIGFTGPKLERTLSSARQVDSFTANR